MMSKRIGLAWASVLASAVFSLGSPAGAADANPPGADASGGRHEIQVPPDLLDAYAGFYLLGQNAVLTVKREADHLSIQLTGQPAAPVFAESRTRFFAKVVDAQFTFQPEPDGRIGAVMLHQNGRDIVLPRVDAAKAQAVAALTEAKVKAQSASPGTEAAVRKLEASLAVGAPDYDAMTPALAAVTRPQLPRLQSYLTTLGPIRSVQFLGVNAQGADVYDIHHESGITHWTIVLDPAGKISGALVQAGP
jgi:hypothetical protein